MRALSFDPATWTGYCFGIFGKKPHSGMIKLPERDDVIANCCHLEGRVRDLIDADKPDVILIESMHIALFASGGTRKVNITQVKTLAYYQAAIRMAAWKMGIMQRDIIEAPATEWRSKFGIPPTPDHIRKSKKSGESARWLKIAVFERCRELGWDPHTEDESDAMGLWAYGEQLFAQFEANERLPLFATARLEEAR